MFDDTASMASARSSLASESLSIEPGEDGLLPLLFFNSACSVPCLGGREGLGIHRRVFICLSVLGRSVAAHSQLFEGSAWPTPPPQASAACSRSPAPEWCCRPPKRTLPAPTRAAPSSPEPARAHATRAAALGACC